jgi:hypothetical protein
VTPMPFGLGPTYNTPQVLAPNGRASRKQVHAEIRSMSDSPAKPPNPRPRHDREYEDPHYHDEDLEVQHDEGKAPAPSGLGRKKPARLLPPRRRYEE